VLEPIWRAADCPWSVRLKALLPLWLPWARKHLHQLSPDTERQLLAISPRQSDRRLAPRKRQLKRRLYGRTKPGGLLRHQVPVRTEAPSDTLPGHTEVDLVSHSGPSARGEFAYSLNLTDLATGWCESRPLLGPSQKAVFDALRAIQATLVRAMNDLYSGQLRLMMNLFQPSVKLRHKTRCGSRLRRHYDPPRTPLDRLADAYPKDQMPPAIQRLLALRKSLDPFELSATIEAKLRTIESTTTERAFVVPDRTPTAPTRPPTASLGGERPSQEGPQQ